MPKETPKQEKNNSSQPEEISSPKFDLERCLKKKESLISHLKHMIDYNKKNKALLSRA